MKLILWFFLSIYPQLFALTLCHSHWSSLLRITDNFDFYHFVRVFHTHPNYMYPDALSHHQVTFQVTLTLRVRFFVISGTFTLLFCTSTQDKMSCKYPLLIPWFLRGSSMLTILMKWAFWSRFYCCYCTLNAALVWLRAYINTNIYTCLIVINVNFG